MSPRAKSAPAGNPNLTAEQKHRMEESRRRALARKREKEELQKQKQRQLQMQRAEENRRRALATKEARRRNRAAMGAASIAVGAADAKRAKMENADDASANDADLKLPPIQRTVDGVTLSEEQYQILALARPPPSRESRKQRHLVRITAAAGTGKTTTLIRLALRCFQRVMSSLGTFAPASEWRVTDMITCRLIRS